MNSKSYNMAIDADWVKMNYKWLDTTSTIFGEFNEQLKYINSGQFSQIRSIQDSVRSLMESYNSFLQSQISQEILKVQQQFANITLELAKPLAEFSESIKLAHRNLISAGVADIYMATSKSMAMIANQFQIDMSPIVKALNDLKSVNFEGINIDSLLDLRMSSEDYGDIEVNEDGTISVSNDKIRIEDIKEAVNSCLKESGLIESTESLHRQLNTQGELINRLINEIQKLKGTKLGQIVVLIIIPVILGILINNSFSLWAKPLTDGLNSLVEKSIVRTIKKETSKNSVLDKAILKEYRFVTKRQLYLRAGATKNSPVITYLELGQVVRVIYKNKNWTKVEYCETETNEVIDGWVLTRYISPFK